MGPKSRTLVAQGFGSIELALRAILAQQERDSALLSAIATKLGVTDSDVDRHDRVLREHSRALTELDLRVYAGGKNGAE